MSRKSDSMRFVERGSHVECQRQIGGRRFHASWPTWKAMEDDFIALFELRKAGVSLTDLVSQADAGATAINNFGPKGAINFEDFCDGAFTKMRERKGAWAHERCRLRFILADPHSFKGRPLHTIREHEVREWYESYCRRPRVTSDNTRANMLKTMRAVFKAAKELGYLRENPAREIHAPQVPDTQARALAHGECVRLYAAADPTVRPWILFTLYTGLRPIEVSRLTSGQVNLADRKLSVVGNTRKNRSRDIYIHDALVPVVKELSSSIPNVPLLRDAEGNPLKFPRHAFNLARKAANLLDITFYELRHTFETRLHDLDVSEEVRAYVMGHKHRSMTSRYTHVSFEKVREAIGKLCGIIASRETPKGALGSG